MARIRGMARTRGIPKIRETAKTGGITGNDQTQGNNPGNEPGLKNAPPDDSHLDMLTHIDQDSAEINWDYAAIERLDMSDLSTRLIPFNLGKALDAPTSADNEELQAGDVITVFSRKDLALPMEKHVHFVRVAGEVNAPGVYRIQPGDTLRDVVRQAGGLTSDSYIYASVLTRISAQKIQQEQLDQSILRMKRDLVSKYANTPQSITGTSTATVNTAEYAMEQNLIDQLSLVKPTGRIVLDMKQKSMKVEDFPDLALEDGDSLTIPARLGTVQIVGAVYNESAFRYEARRTLGQYLKAAGGASRDADVSRIYLLRADGTTVNIHSSSPLWKGNFEKLTLSPGDAIVVPLRIRTQSSFWTNFAPVAQILSQTAMTGVLMLTAF